MTGTASRSPSAVPVLICQCQHGPLPTAPSRETKKKEAPDV